jgi:hypothetical protein
MVTKLELEKIAQERRFDERLAQLVLIHYLDTLRGRYDEFFDPYDCDEREVLFDPISLGEIYGSCVNGVDLSFWESGLDDDEEEEKIVFKPYNISLNKIPEGGDTVSLCLETLVPVDCQFAKYLRYEEGCQREEGRKQSPVESFGVRVLGIKKDSFRITLESDDKRWAGAYIMWKPVKEEYSDASDMFFSVIAPSFPRESISEGFMKILIEERKGRGEK